MELCRKEKYLQLSADIDGMVNELSGLDERMKRAQGDMNRFGFYEEILAVQETASYQTLLDAREELSMRLNMWRSIKEFRVLSEQWSQLPFGQVNAKQIAAKTDNYVRIVNRC